MVLNLALILGIAGVMKNRSSDEDLSKADSIDSIDQPAPPSSAEPEVIYVTNKVAAPTGSGKSFNWELVESSDYREYIDNLRAIGCPEETIRDIIMADVGKLFDERAKAKRAEEKPYEFWKTGNMFAEMFKKEHLEEQQAAQAEKKDLLKALLGEDIPVKPDMNAMFNPFERALGYLSDEKQAKVMEEFQSLQVVAAEKFGSGQPDRKDLEEILTLRKGMDDRLKSILSPDEFERYQFTLSDTANMMRAQLHGFEPNEKEFRDIFAMKQEFSDNWGPYGQMGLNSEERKEYKEAEKALNEQIKGLLGDDRYGDYEMVQNHEFKNFYRLAERGGQGREEAAAAVDIKKEAQKAAREIQGNRDLTWDQKLAALEPIQSATQEELSKLFGEQMERYNDSAQSDWLNDITKNRNPPTKTFDAPTVTVP